MIEIPPEPYEAFLCAPVSAVCADSRFDVRRIREEEFDKVYDCVDAAFGRIRQRAVYDWLYRHNPYGRALVWAVVERSTGRILKTGAKFPWPVWRGDRAICGALSGDAATVPEWQRRGLSNIRSEVTRSHPWRGKICTISGPNEGSRAVSIKVGEEDEILGRLTGGVIVLRAFAPRERAGLSAALAGLSNSIVSGLLGAWQSLALRQRSSGGCRFVELARFGPEFDELTLQTMAFPGYWCPHSWALLNWRYLDHPAERYVAFALIEGDVPVGYSVLRIAGSRATITEFAVAHRPVERANALLTGTLDAARQAGCAYVGFFGTPAWRHWSTFRRGGMLPYPTNNYFEVAYDVDPEGSRDLRNWQVVPGDRDYH